MWPRLLISFSVLAGLTAPPAAGRLLKVDHVGGVPGRIVTAPPGAMDDAIASDTHMLGFDERQNVVLTEDLAVDGDVIPAGTRIDSHMILLNVPDDIPWSTGSVNIWTFDQPVLGVMSDIGGNLEAASSAFLGAPGTRYPASFPFRGLEGEDGYSGVGSTSLRVVLNVWQPGDWIRVITAARPIARTPSPVQALGGRHAAVTATPFRSASNRGQSGQ